MNPWDELVVEPPLAEDTVERIRRRGRRVLVDPPSARTEAALVAVFSVATLAWAVLAVVHVTPSG